jgi:hypothetical protein
MLKLYITTLLLTAFNITSAMNAICRLPSEEVIKDRLFWAINERFNQPLGGQFIAATHLHGMANQNYTPLSVASSVDGAVLAFCERTFNRDKSLAYKKPLQQIVLYEMLKDYPMVITALQNNYDFLPHDLSSLRLYKEVIK